jgi:2-enoate reductase
MMQKKFEALFQPMKVGKCEIKNRFIYEPMAGTSLIEGLTELGYNEKVHDFYMERAKSGVGLIIPGSCPIRTWKEDKWIYEFPEFFEPVKDFMKELHAYGTKLFMQFSVGVGRNITLGVNVFNALKVPELKEKIPFNFDNLLVGPSELPCVFEPETKTRVLTVEEIKDIIIAFGKTALLCKEAGVDGIEVHALHEGYILDQFGTRYTNQRTDEYGGSLENRYRFAIEIVKEIKKVCGEDYPVSIRYSVESKVINFNVGAIPGEEFEEIGRTREESKVVVKMLEEAGYDMINADNGTYDSWYWAHPPVYMPLNCNLSSVEYIKPFVNIPVICAGRMEPEMAAKEIAEGRIDAIGIGRQFLADGDFIAKIQNDKEEDILPCIACHNGCLPIAHYKGACAEIPHTGTGHCALNPRTLREKEKTLNPTKIQKKIAIIGGGIGGMEAARVASLRGHEVTVYEKGKELGGVFIAAAAPDFKEKDKQLLDWYRRQMKHQNISICTNTEITNLDEIQADEYIIATGALPRKLNVSGGEKAISAVDYLLGKKEIGEREQVAIVGGGLTGCEIAYDLALKGKKPIIVEMLDDVVKAPGISAANSGMLRDIIRYYEIPAYFESSLKEITEDGIIISSRNGIKKVQCDTVIASIGYVSNVPFGNFEAENIHILGDASKVGNLMTAIYAAYDLAMTL